MKAKLAKDLMEAYASVYTQSEEVIAESDCECEDGEKSEKETPEMNGKKKVKKKVKKEEEKEDEMKEGYDLFDYLLEYLVAEGYADTNESALVIMANMSEEWRQSIVEGGFPGTPSTPRSGDAGTSGLKMIRTTGGGTGYTNKYSSGETLPSGTVNKIMSGQLMVKKQSNTDTKTA